MRQILSLVPLVSLLLTAPAAAQKIDPSLVERADRAIEKLRARELRSGTDTPWVVVHALIAFGPDVEVFDDRLQKKVNAVDWLLTDARYADVRIWRDEYGSPAIPTRGAGMQRSFQLQDHTDQFLMAFATADVSPDRELIAQGEKTFRVADLVTASQKNYDQKQELGWTLIALSHYVGFQTRWMNSAGEEVSVESIMATALSRDATKEAEGGTHHLYGIAWTLNLYLAQGGENAGVWKEARQYLNKYILQSHDVQLPGGGFSRGIFGPLIEPTKARDALWATGHMVEWLVVALPPERLRREWITKPIGVIADLINENSMVRFTDGGLYHAVHALRLWKAGVSRKTAPAPGSHQ